MKYWKATEPLGGGRFCRRGAKRRRWQSLLISSDLCPHCSSATLRPFESTVAAASMHCAHLIPAAHLSPAPDRPANRKAGPAAAGRNFPRPNPTPQASENSFPDRRECPPASEMSFPKGVPPDHHAEKSFSVCCHLGYPQEKSFPSPCHFPHLPKKSFPTCSRLE